MHARTMFERLVGCPHKPINWSFATVLLVVAGALTGCWDCDVGLWQDLERSLHADYLFPMMRECYIQVVVRYVQEFVQPKKFRCKTENDVTDMMKKFEGEIDSLSEVFTPFFKGAPQPVNDPYVGGAKGLLSLALSRALSLSLSLSLLRAHSHIPHCSSHRLSLCLACPCTHTACYFAYYCIHCLVNIHGGVAASVQKVRLF